jgi:type IV pilus assembly protein PilM
MLAEKAIKAKSVNVCAPGFHVFSKFVKLPPVDAGKVTQIIQYEAQQNVPFPLEEVVWDYQILGSTPGGELEVLLVAIKADIVEGLFRVTETSGLRLQLTDVSPAALCNAFRYNYGDLEDCTMLLDIGAKTSNLLFFEKGKVFSRSINLGANSITQDFANESKLKFEAAEKLKIEEGFVSLGGAYEEPENPHQAAISKIARQFMTRLHIQVNQTMQFYRGQQGGSAPQRLFLSGGASIMPYTAQFFAEKLNVPVEYFNPLRNVQIDPSVNLEQLARVAHSLGEVVGLGLRNLAHCPIELNLIPESTRRWQSFNEKKPYLIATVFSLVAVVGAMGLMFQKLAGAKEEAYSEIESKVAAAKSRESRFDVAYRDLGAASNQLDQVTTWIESRYYWADVMAEFRRVLIRTEQACQKKLRTETGVWIERFQTTTGAGEEMFSTPFGMPSGEGRPVFRDTRLGGEGEAPPPPPEGASVQATIRTLASPGTNEIAVINILCRAVSLANVLPEFPDANITIMYTFENQLRESTNYFDPKETQLVGSIINDEATGTFAFNLSVVLKKPLKL